MRLRRLATMVLIGAALIGLLLMFRRELPVGQLKLHETAFAQSDQPGIVWPAHGSAALGTLEHGPLLTSRDDEQPRPIASLAKVITALAVLEKAPMEPGEPGITFTLDAADEELYRHYVSQWGTVSPVTAGWQMNQYQALQAILLPSSNNMADSLARRVFGSVDEYVAYANDMLQRSGLKRTRVADATGFSPDTVSTPSELIRIGQKAIAHPVLAEIVAQPTATLPSGDVIYNYNRLLLVDGVTGIKPGNTDEAGLCLLFSARHIAEDGHEETLLGVVLGAPDQTVLYDSSRQLLDSAKAHFQRIEVARKGETIGTYTLPWGETVDVMAGESVWLYGWPGSRLSPEVAPDEDEDANIAGKIRLRGDDQLQVPVVLSSAPPGPPLLWRLSRAVQL